MKTTAGIFGSAKAANTPITATVSGVPSFMQADLKIQNSSSAAIIPVYNSEIPKEYREVLSRPKFHFTREIVDDVLENLEHRGICVDTETLDILLPDPKDRVFYEVVLEERKTEEAWHSCFL